MDLRIDPMCESDACYCPGFRTQHCILSESCNKDMRFCCCARIFSIDPPTARDLDDALSVEPLPNGNFQVGVHIADVAHFVR